MVRTRKTVILHELIEADLFGEPCEPVSRVAVAAVFKSTRRALRVRSVATLRDRGRTWTAACWKGD